MPSNKQKFDLVVALKAESKEFNKNMHSAKKNMKGFVQGATPAFGALNGQAGMFVGTFQSGVRTMRSMLPAIKSVKAALMASGIGAIVVAIGTALAATSAWITKTTDGADKFQTTLARGKAVMNVYTDRLAKMGRAFFKMHKDFKGGWEDLKDSVKGTFKEIGEEQRKAAEIQKEENQLKKDKINFIVDEAKLQAQISDLIRDSKNLEFDRGKRIEYLNKAIGLQNQLSDKSVGLAQRELAIQQQRMDMGENSYDDLQREAELKVTLFKIEKDRNDKARELENRVREATNALNEDEKLQRKILADAVKINDVYKQIAQTVSDDVDLEPMKEDLAELNREAASMKDIEVDPESFVGLKGVFTDLDNITSIVTGGIWGMSAAFGELAENGKMSMKGMVTSILSSISGLIQGYLAQAIAAMIAGSAKFGPILGLGLASAGIAGLMAMWKSSVPEFASGGLAYGDTLARVGEYRGARSNPEVIAPLSKLQGMMGGNLSGRIDADGTKLAVVLENVNKRNKMFG